MLHSNNTIDIARTKGISFLFDECDFVQDLHRHMIVQKYMTFHGHWIAFTWSYHRAWSICWVSSFLFLLIFQKKWLHTLTHSQKRKMLQNHCSLNHVSLRIFPFFWVPTSEWCWGSSSHSSTVQGGKGQPTIHPEGIYCAHNIRIKLFGIWWCSLVQFLRWFTVSVRICILPCMYTNINWTCPIVHAGGWEGMESG